MPLLSAEQLHQKYGQFATMAWMYNFIHDAVESGSIKKDEITGKNGKYTVAGYCELCFCKHVFASRRSTFAAKIFAHNVQEITKILACERK